MDINLQVRGAVPSLPGAQGADAPIRGNKDAAATPQSLPGADVKVPDVEQQRYERLQRAAQQLFDNVYAVSDTTFSIFKDSTGQYVTRFTSLRDGRVTYIPEPKVLDYASRKIRDAQASIEIRV